jgi:plastocyanin
MAEEAGMGGREAAHGLVHKPKNAVGCTGTRSAVTEVACGGEAIRTDGPRHPDEGDEMGAAFTALTTSRVARIAAVVAVALVSAVAFAATSSAQDKTIRTMGTEDVHINSKIFSNLRFSPGHTTLNSGDQLTLSHEDATDEPHTLTIANASELPSDVEDVFGCGEPGT